MMSDIKDMYEIYHQDLARLLEDSLSQIDSSLSAGEKIRRRKAIRCSEVYSRLRWKQRAIRDEEIEDVKFWLRDLMIPYALARFVEWSWAFYFHKEKGMNLRENSFSQSKLNLKFPSGNDIYTNNLEILFNKRKPLEFRKVLVFGEYDRHDIGVILSPGVPQGGEVVLFEKRSRAGAAIKDEFKVIASNVDRFLRRLFHCYSMDNELNLISPMEKDIDWIKINESTEVFDQTLSADFPYSFKELNGLKKEWRVSDYAAEIEHLVLPKIERFGGRRDLKGEKIAARNIQKKYGVDSAK